MTAVPELSPAEVVAFRLDGQHLLDETAASPAQLAAAMVGAHAQIPTAAELSFAARSPELTRSDVQTAIGTELIRTFGPRGTVHLFPARDLSRWLSALATAPPAVPAMPDGVRLEKSQIAAVLTAVDDALGEAATELTIDELSAEVIRRCGPWAADEVMPAFGGFWPRWRQALAVAGHAGALCHGAGRGRQVTYTSPRRLVPDLTVRPGPDAVDWLVEAFLQVYGPSTAPRFARWFGAPPAWAREQFDRLGSRLTRVVVAGEQALLRTADLDRVQGGSPAGTVLVLPYFDPFVVGSHPRTWLYPGDAATRALTPSGQAGNFPVVVIDGTVGGVWHLARKGRRAVVTVDLLRRPPVRIREAIEGRIGRFGRFLQLDIDIVWDTVTVGPHA